MADWVLVREAARRLNVSVKTIYVWIDNGGIQEKDIGLAPNGYTVINFENILQVRAKPRKKYTYQDIDNDTHRQQRTDRDSQPDNANSQGYSSGGIESGELQRLHMDESSGEYDTDRKETVGGDIRGPEQSRGTVTEAFEHSPNGQAYTTNRGSSSTDPTGDSSDEINRERSINEGPELFSEDKTTIQLAFTSESVLGDNNNDKYEGDS